LKLAFCRYFNFKILKNTQIEFHPSNTLLIGKNNSGKTSILEGLFFALNKQLSTKLQSEGVFKNYFNKKSLSNDFTVFLVAFMEQDDLNEAIEKSAGQLNNLNINEMDTAKLLRLPIAITATVNKFSGFQYNYQFVDTLSVLNRFVMSDIELLLDILIDKLKNLTVFISPKRKLPEKEPFTPFNEVLSDTDKDQYICHYLFRLKERYPDDFYHFRNEFKKIFYDVELNPIIDYDLGLVKVLVEQEGSQFDITEMGSGFKYLLLIIAKILALKAKIVIIDEPDLNMHPDLIRKFVKYLNSRRDLQVIISSHNETFVNEFDNESIRYVYSFKNYSAHIKKIEESLWLNLMDDLGIYVSNFGKSRLISSELVVLFEGSEKKIFLKLAEKKGLIDKLQSLNVTYNDTGGTNRIPDFKMLDKLDKRKQPIIVVRDRDENDSQFIEKQVTRSEGRIYYWKRRDIESYAFSYQGILNTIRQIGRDLKAKEVNLINLNKISIDDIKNVLRTETQILKQEILLLRILRKYKILKLLNYDELSEFKNKYLGKSDAEVITALLNIICEKYKTINYSDLETYFAKEREVLINEWNDDSILRICSGKKLIKILNRWLQKFGIQISIMDLIENLEAVDDDIEDLVNKISDMCVVSDAYKFEYAERSNDLRLVKEKSFYSNTEPDSINFDTKTGLLIIKGYRETDKKISHDNIIGVLDSNTLNFEYEIKIELGDEKWVNIKQLYLDSNNRKMLVSCVYLPNNVSKDKVKDSVYVVDLLERKVTNRIDFYETYSEGKEGSIAGILLNGNKIYASLVYAEGGAPGLYIEDLKSGKHKELQIKGPGPQDLVVYSDNVYTFGCEGDKPYVFQIHNENIHNKIPIKGTPGGSYRGPNRISLDPIEGDLFVLSDNLLELISLINEKIINSMPSKGIHQVITYTTNSTLKPKSKTYVRCDSTRNGLSTSSISIINDDFEIETCYELPLAKYFNVNPSNGNCFVISKKKHQWDDREYKLTILEEDK
jgi:predicted ATP-dependent endonuclease of OLD family